RTRGIGMRRGVPGTDDGRPGRARPDPSRACKPMNAGSQPPVPMFKGMSARAAATLALWVPVADRPRLRGWLHVIGFVLALPAGAVLVAHADPGRPRVGALVYALGMVLLFGV